MEDKHKLIDDVQQTPREGSGSLLASARKQSNRSVEEIADELNLSVTQIRAIELDQSEGLPEPTYVRGYIRSYAKLLGLDEKEVLDHYLNPNWQKGSRLDEMPRGIGSASDNEDDGFFTPIKIVMILILLGAVSFLWFSGKLDGLFGARTAPVISSPVVAEPEATESLIPEPDIVDGEASLASDSDTGAEPVPDVLEPSHELVLNFNDTSWIDIRDADGQRLAFKSYAEGEELIVSSAISMSVFIGKAKAVSVLYNGEEFDISRYREGVFARFTIGE